MRIAAGLLWLLFALRLPAATNVWIDTDPAIGAPWHEVDDAFALILAFHSPELRIAGISSTYGNAALPRTTAVARDLVRRFGGAAKLGESDVHAGASSARDAATQTEASEALARALRSRRLTYIAIGPLTNLAAFLHLHPELAGRIERVIFVGGRSPERPPAFGPARSFRIHDANVFKDPTSVAAVLQSAIPITLAAIETAPELALTKDDLQQFRGSGTSGNFLATRTRQWVWFWTTVVRERGGLPFDALAILPAIRPELLRTERRQARLDEGGELIAGRSAIPHARPVQFSFGVSTDARSLFLRRLQISER